MFNWVRHQSNFKTANSVLGLHTETWRSRQNSPFLLKSPRTSINGHAGWLGDRSCCQCKLDSADPQTTGQHEYHTLSQPTLDNLDVHERLPSQDTYTVLVNSLLLGFFLTTTETVFLDQWKADTPSAISDASLFLRRGLSPSVQKHFL